MITCDNRSIKFTWPDHDAEFKKVAASYFGKWLPCILAEDRSIALERLLKNRFTEFTSGQKTLARRLVMASDTGWILSLFQEITAAYIVRETSMSIHLEPCYRPGRGWKSMPSGNTGILPARPVLPSDQLPKRIASVGGVTCPLYQSEAVSIHLSCLQPMAIKIAARRTNAFTGKPWKPGLNRANPDYLVVYDACDVQGYVAPKQKIRQFIPSRIPASFPILGPIRASRFRSILVEAYPIRPAVLISEVWNSYLPKSIDDILVPFLLRLTGKTARINLCHQNTEAPPADFDDPFDSGSWDLDQPRRIWIHLCDALTWVTLTGELPTPRPISRKEYGDWNLPWRESYAADLATINTTPALARLMPANQDDWPYPESFPSRTIPQWSGSV